jgi:hypothetical protein
LPVGEFAEIPEINAIAQYAAPILTAIANGRNGADGSISSLLTEAQQQIAGYVPEAQRLLAEANGVIGEAESIVSDAIDSVIGNRQYGGAVQLVDWLLDG